MSKLCFLAYPFKEPYQGRFLNDISQKVVECGLSSYSGQNEKGDVDLVDNIHQKILQSCLVIAEITELNPNVWYEIGYARGCGKPIILLKDKNAAEAKEKLPFDVSNRNILTFQTGDTKIYGEFLKNLEARINEIRKSIQSDRAESENSAAPPAVLSDNERIVLKRIARELADPQDMVPKETVLKILREEDRDASYLRTLRVKGCLDRKLSASDGTLYYYITEKGDSLLNSR